MTTRRTVLGAAAGLAALGALATGGSPAAAVEIEYWQYFFEARVKAVDQLIAEFQKKNPGITVKHTHFPYADYQTKVAAAIPAGQGPDVVQLFYGWLDGYIDAKLLQPLPAEPFAPAKVEADFFPMIKAMRRGDAYYALPTAVRSLAMFWNKRLFTEAGLDPTRPPATLDELVAMAAKLTRKDGAGNVTQVGITMDMTAQDHHWWREILVRQMGGEPYTDDYRKVAYASDAGAKALEYYVDLQRRHGVAKMGFMDEAQAGFKAGRAAMHIDGSFRIGALERTRGLEWAVGELPAGPTGVKSNFASYWVNGVTTKAQGEKHDAAVKLMAYLVSPEAMQLWLKVVGELPARPAVALTPENVADPVYGPFIKGLEYAHATVFADETQQRQIAIDMVNRMLLENAPIPVALAEAAAKEQALLDRVFGKR
jgi:multiple sugar transport system substrate-binding protein